jgi:signal transduction histidine kinase
LPGVIYQFLVRTDGTTSVPFAAGRTLDILGLTEAQLTSDPSLPWAIVHPDDVEAVRDAVARSVGTVTNFEAELRFGRGQEWRWARARSTPVRVAEGVLFTGVILDITEERVLAERLRRAQRREIMGDLTAGVAHNFNNMLAAVLPNLEAVREDMTAAASASALDDAINATRRASDLVRQLMYVARGDYEGQPEPVELRAIVDEVASLCRRSFDSAIAIEVDTSKCGSTLTFGRASQVHQVVLNLCLNARDAMARPDKRQLHISLSDGAGPVPGLADGDGHIELTIRDTGIGMAEATLRRLGEPFFTTKPPGQGTGLGVASAMATVREMAGHVDVVSELGVGTTVRIHVPRFRGSAKGPVVAAPSPTVVDPIGSVLLVEDEPLVRKAVERMLGRFCKRTVSAGDGLAALELLEAQRGSFDAVLLDLSMPGASGREVLAKIRERWPRLPVVIMSGNTGSRDGLEGAAQILDKPLTLERLASALRRAVHAR